MEGKNSKNKVPGLVLVNRDKGDWSADLMVFEQGLRHSFSEKDIAHIIRFVLVHIELALKWKMTQ